MSFRWVRRKKLFAAHELRVKSISYFLSKQITSAWRFSLVDDALSVNRNYCVDAVSRLRQD